MKVLVSAREHGLHVVLFCVGLGVVSCSSLASRTKMVPLHLATLEQHLQNLEESHSGASNRLLYLLERGMLLQLQGQYEASTMVWQEAKRKLLALQSVSVSEQARAVLLNDLQIPYSSASYEQLLLHLFLAFNYLAQGDIGGARVEMLQANVELTLQEGRTATRGHANGLLYYFSGLIYELSGEVDNALIAYRKAYLFFQQSDQQIPSVVLRDRYRLAAMLEDADKATEGGDSDDTAADVAFEPLPSQPETVGIMAHRSGEQAMATILDREREAARGELLLVMAFAQIEGKRQKLVQVDVPYPVIVPSYRPRLRPTLGHVWLHIGQHRRALAPLSNLDRFARQALVEDYPAIIAREIARKGLLMKMQQEAAERSALLGSMLGLGGVLSQAADVRSWSLLPQSLHFVRLSLPAGEHSLQLEMEGTAAYCNLPAAVPVVAKQWTWLAVRCMVQ